MTVRILQPGSFLLAATLIATFATLAVAQPGASGGTINPDSGPSSKPVTKPNAKAPPKTATKSNPRTTTNETSRAASRSTAVRAASLDRIDGKWWTVGNDFGDSEVVFTQNGANVTGVINYADGRTGSITGTLVGKKLQHRWTNSSGDGGSGWLELSWSNFLGGPWHNQRVRDGSWTLRRIEGQWCFEGNRSRIRTVTHNARGQMLVITEDGSQDEGRLVGPRIFLDSDYGSIEGSMYFKGNRINWTSGAYWTWCGR